MNLSKRNGIACYYCRRAFDSDVTKTKDHVVAKSRGGFNTAQNYVDCCRDCNQWKGDKSLEYWLHEVKSFLDRGKHPNYTKSQLGQIVGNIKKLLTELKQNKKLSTHKLR